MKFKKNLPLLLAISIPILMVIFVAVSIYLPGAFVHPKVNFLYSIGDYSYRQSQYYVQNSRLMKSDVASSSNRYMSQEPIKLFVHDVSNNTNREVTYEETSTLNLDSNNVSSDGFEVVHGSSGSSFPFLFFDTNSDYNTYYLKGKNVSKKINLQLSGTSSYYNFRFLGWIQ